MTARNKGNPASNHNINKPSDIAIVGMACLLPRARSIKEYWENLINKVDCLREIPPERWDWREYYDPDPTREDRINSKWGGFIDPIPFDPAAFGMVPNSVHSVEPMQLLTLATARAALDDAGYIDRPFPNDTTSVILGIGSGIADLASQYSFKAHSRLFFHHADKLDRHLPPWTEDSYPGILPNVTAGRIANRFDLGGVNYIVDAACGSSLGAVYQAVKELETGTSDMVITGGAEASQNPFAYFCFSKTQALSPTGECKVFDQDANGTVLSEGIVIMVLKRLADAVQDNDRIYAVIKAVVGSSDGRDKGLTAPRAEGQLRALERAFAKAGVNPRDVGLIEAHGTGTVVGDRIEIESLSRIFQNRKNTVPTHALGSVKSLIGHTKGTAGAAGLAKAALALYHKVLPPTANVKSPNAALDNTPLYLNTRTRPWLHVDKAAGRCASVSAFGFGGTNFHAVLEEYDADAAKTEAAAKEWPSEIFVWRGDSARDISRSVQGLLITLQNTGPPSLAELADKIWNEARPKTGKTLAIIASSKEELRNKILKFTNKVEATNVDKPFKVNDATGIYYSDAPLAAQGKTAYLFPGQGAQYPGMLEDLAIHFPEVRQAFESADAILAEKYERPLSSYIFPPPFFSKDQEKEANRNLSRTHITQPAVGAASLGICRLLAALEVQPDMACGHSYGEISALRQAGVIGDDAFFTISELRGRLLAQAGEKNPGGMAAINAEAAVVEPMLKEYSELWIANCNSPNQTVVSGQVEEIEKFVARAREADFRATRLPVSGAFHTPFLNGARNGFSEVLNKTEFSTARFPVYNNSRGTQYPAEFQGFRDILAEQIVSPVRFIEEVRAMYEEGARIFIEAGPRNILGTLVNQILDGPVAIVTLDDPLEHGITRFLFGLGRMMAEGGHVNLDRLFYGRIAKDTEPKADKRASSTRIMLKPGRIWPGPDERPDFSCSAPASSVVALPNLNVPMQLLQNRNGPADIDFTSGDMDSVVLQYQKTMQRFLKMQRRIMLAYLGSDPAIVPDATIAAASKPRKKEPPAVKEPPQANKQETVPTPGLARLDGKILALVSDRTGYPLDMLDPDVDMEADMGIDSIKRVEILGAIRKELLSQYGEPDEQRLLVLGERKTLRGIIEWGEDFAGQAQSGSSERVKKEPQAEPQKEIVQPEIETQEQEDLILPRYEVRITEMAFQDEAAEVLPASGVVVITDDGQGLAKEICVRLREKGLATVVLRLGDPEVSGTDQELTCRFDIFAEAVKLIETIREKKGKIAGLLHLSALRTMKPFDELTLEEWKARLNQDVKSFFNLIKAAAGDLQDQAETDRAWIAGVTNLGGTFTLEETISATFHPGHGGIAGMLKALQREWPKATCKAIDIDPQLDTPFVAQQIIRELVSLQWDVEVGFRGKQRLVVRVIPAPLADDPQRAAPLEKDDVVVITGGARGITAAIAMEIAERYQPTLLLIGRSPLMIPEAVAAADLDDPKEIRALLFAKMKEKDSSVKPADVERVFQKLQNCREMNNNIAVMEAAGSTVRYFQADVCDATAMAETLQTIYDDYGRIDVFVHGAGIIEDSFIGTKTPESFARVFDTKTVSIFILERYLQLDSLKLMVLFSSVVGRFGNAGQLDYAAANEVMNKVACRMNMQLPGRIVAIDWGPWADAGMASPEVQAQLRERGIKLVDPPRGRFMFDREIRLGRKKDVEIVIGGGLWGSKDEEIRLTTQDVLPLLDNDPPGLVGHEVWHYSEIIDLPRHPYLLSHLMASKPVMPAAIVMELMAEVIKYGWNDWFVTGLENLRIIKGIIIYPGRTGIKITVYPEETQTLSAGSRLVEARAFQADKPKFPTHTAKFVLAHQLPDPPSYDPATLGDLQPYPLTIEECYDQLLFHGPKLKHVEEVLGIGENTLRTRMRISDPSKFLDRQVEHGWIIDPVIIDCLSQQINFWTRAKLGSSSFPTSLASCRLFDTEPAEHLFCDTRITKVSSGGTMVAADIRLWNENKETVLLIENMEFSSSEKLNYLHKEELRSEMILDD